MPKNVIINFALNLTRGKASLNIYAKFLLLIPAMSFVISCRDSSESKMIRIIAGLNQKDYNSRNPFCPEAKVAQCDSLLKLPGRENDFYFLNTKAKLLLETGDETQAVAIYEKMMMGADSSKRDLFEPDMALAYMRLGERTNCMLNHNRMSCTYPIRDNAIHVNQTGSRHAIAVYESILKKHPADLESRWMLNIAYMTLGHYPDSVPKPFLIPDLDKTSATKIKPFIDMAADVGIKLKSRAGGVIADDFNNDGYLDIVTSGTELDDHMHYFQNNQDGTFIDKSETSGLRKFTGGLNIQQTDYNNDGKMDIFVLRGAWKKNGFGNQPASLLRNNGDGTFTDVTIPAGLLFYHPTQAAGWADFNNDGWLDVFVGAEGFNNGDSVNIHRSMLYINNRNGTFTEVGHKAHCDVMSYVKGVTSADFNHDGWPDVFISTMDGRKYLLKNKGNSENTPDFEDITRQSGILANSNSTFTTWFFDYNNDGWQDILIADYKFEAPLGYYSAAEALGKPIPNAGNIYLYKNNHNGTFTDVTKQTGLDKVVFSMGANFGDIDNDGFPDLYFGTGNPDFGSLIPNKMFRNVGGQQFEDVTGVSGTGNLQKGHGVAFADFRNRGLQDIFIEMGGAYAGDAYTSALYVNPGQNDNNWISIKAEGIKSNKAAIGSRLKITFVDNGVKKNVYHDLNSGGSFGSSPIQAEIGVGHAGLIEELEITWAGSHSVQRFRNLKVNQFYHITEGNGKAASVQLKKLNFNGMAGLAMKM
ncbi:CRTAC1 family protein [Mucilaginibacter rubeus]|nr:CRTAC1 family protein [Mucilaginibacter rubeus]